METNLFTCRELLRALKGRITRLQIVQAVQQGKLRVYKLKGRGYYDLQQAAVLATS